MSDTQFLSRLKAELKLLGINTCSIRKRVGKLSPGISDNPRCIGRICFTNDLEFTSVMISGATVMIEDMNFRSVTEIIGDSND